MKQGIIKYLPIILNRIINGFFIAVGLLTILFVVKLTFNYYANHFNYKEVAALKEYNVIDEPFFLTRRIERYTLADMNYDDTLRCGFTSDDLFWYSQITWLYNSAPVGKFYNKWKYEGKTPTVPMVCQVRSLASIKLSFGINTEPQLVESPFFYFVQKPIDIPSNNLKV